MTYFFTISKAKINGLKSLSRVYERFAAGATQTALDRTLRLVCGAFKSWKKEKYRFNLNHQTKIVRQSSIYTPKTEAKKIKATFLKSGYATKNWT
jgi:hypothetical protein